MVIIMDVIDASVKNLKEKGKEMSELDKSIEVLREEIKGHQGLQKFLLKIKKKTPNDFTPKDKEKLVRCEEHIKALSYIINLLTRPVKGILPDLPQTTWGDVADDSGLGDKYSCRSRLIAYRQEVAQNIKLLRLEGIIEKEITNPYCFYYNDLLRLGKITDAEHQLAHKRAKINGTKLAQAIRQALEGKR